MFTWHVVAESYKLIISGHYFGYVLRFTEYQNSGMVPNFYRWKETYQYVYIMSVLQLAHIFVKCIGSFGIPLNCTKNETVTIQTNQHPNKPSN